MCGALTFENHSNVIVASHDKQLLLGDGVRHDSGSDGKVGQ
jgi:hypothetical protein